MGIKAKRTRPYRPQTNGKTERFHRTFADGWTFARMFLSESARPKALPATSHEYSHHRPHDRNRPPITRLTNLSEQYNQVIAEQSAKTALGSTRTGASAGTLLPRRRPGPTPAQRVRGHEHHRLGPWRR